jgi:hypothetical protein
MAFAAFHLLQLDGKRVMAEPWTARGSGSRIFSRRTRPACYPVSEA